MVKKMNLLYVLLVALSLFLSALAGSADLKGRQSVPVTIGKRRFIVSKEHLYHDSLYLLVLVIVLKVAF